MKFKDLILEGYSYSCVMLLLSDNLTNKIKNFIKEKIEDSSLYKEEGENGLSKHIHITIKYGLEESNVEPIKDLLNGFGGIPIKLGKIQKFSNDEYDVLKINVYGTKLRESNKLISDNIKNKDKFPVYNPHITLAYCKKGSCDNLVGSDIFDGISEKCNKIYFTTPSEQEYFFNI